MPQPDSSASIVKNIILVGFMGCGKSTIGRLISKQLNYPLLDTDSIISSEIGSPISEIFKLHGEEYFRDLETSLLQKISANNNGRQIISTGGGLPIRSENRQLLKSLGFVVWLQASTDIILARTKNSTHRPLLQTPDPHATIDALLKQRNEIYSNCAHLTIQTDELDADETAHGIIESARYHFSNLA